ncbi:YybS family protein [Lentibacillus halophilus]|uniref:YybS family protein n=1 Tax=Lentibacillus halophilus TaxID=295065 RepID=A0ABN0Z788_9BACI
MDQSNQWRDGALLTIIYMLIALVAVFVPVIPFVAVFLLPVPFIVFASRYDWKSSIIMVLAASGLTMVLLSVHVVPLPVLMGLGGVAIGSAIYRKHSAYETLASGTLGFVVGFVMLFLYSQLVLQVDLISEWNSVMDESISMSQDVIEEFGMAGEAEDQMQAVKDQLDMLLELIPVWIVLISLLMAFISQWVSYKVITKWQNHALQFPPFRMFRLPLSLIWVYFVALMLSFLDLSGMTAQAVHNVMMLAGLLIALQGLSFIFYYTYVKRITKALPVMSVLLTIFLPFIFLFLVRLLGIIDIGFALRDRIANGKT